MPCIDPKRDDGTREGTLRERIWDEAEGLYECAEGFDRLVAACVEYDRLQRETKGGGEAHSPEGGYASRAAHQRAADWHDDIPDSRKVDYRRAEEEEPK